MRKMKSGELVLIGGAIIFTGAMVYFGSFAGGPSAWLFLIPGLFVLIFGMSKWSNSRKK